MQASLAPERVAVRRDLVVIGASAGGVETLRRVVGGLPPNLPAAICVVLHIAEAGPSALAAILARACRLPCRTAADGDPLRLGEILVAPPAHHLVIELDHVRLTVGPRENGHRPAVDALFRSAAAAHGRRVVGVILSGTRDDGSAGLAVIKSTGGTTIVQDPREALYPGMPAHALAHVQVDAVVPSSQVADAVVAAVNGDPPPAAEDTSPPADAPPRLGPSGGESASGRHRTSSGPGPGAERLSPAPGRGRGSGDGRTVGEMTWAEGGIISICPECGGVLSERMEAGVVRWECRVGHRYSTDSLLDAQADRVEAALWTAVRALEDRRVLLERLARRLDSRSGASAAELIRSKARSAVEQANLVREALARVAPVSLHLIPEEPAGG